MKSIYHDLRTFRKQSVFTQEDIAHLLGTRDTSQICRYETKQVNPQIELALLYHILFKTPFASFFPQQKQSLIARLKKRIPNLIDELKCLELSELVNKKIGCLQDILTDINQHE